MNRNDFQNLSNIRIDEAKILLDNAKYNGAYYLAGYSVECALKACIAKETKQHDFPDKKLAESVWTHDLSTLLEKSSLGPHLKKEISTNRDLEVNWVEVRKWNENSRYELKTEKEAKDIYNAITDTKNGILVWLKNHW